MKNNLITGIVCSCVFGMSLQAELITGTFGNNDILDFSRPSDRFMVDEIGLDMYISNDGSGGFNNWQVFLGSTWYPGAVGVINEGDTIGSQPNFQGDVLGFGFSEYLQEEDFTLWNMAFEVGEINYIAIGRYADGAAGYIQLQKINEFSYHLDGWAIENDPQTGILIQNLIPSPSGVSVLAAAAVAATRRRRNQ